ncbi:MAG: hypothetical protein WA430_19640, partial [Acidobacteriaceae bacterium]
MNQSIEFQIAKGPQCSRLHGRLGAFAIIHRVEARATVSQSMRKLTQDEQARCLYDLPSFAG